MTIFVGDGAIGVVVSLVTAVAVEVGLGFGVVVLGFVAVG
jgi:hypothetical protein